MDAGTIGSGAANGAVRNAWRTALFLLGLWMTGSAASACTLSPVVAGDLGTYSPPAIQAGAIPAARSPAGLTCAPSALVVLAKNAVRATFSSRNALKFKRIGGTETIGYVASTDPNGRVPFAQGSTVDYMQNNLLNALGLLGGSSATMPIFLRPMDGSVPVPGTYSDTITIGWDWYLCSAIGALGTCVGTLDRGTGNADLTLTLTVTPIAVRLAISSVQTWDPANGTNQPKALPGGKGRVTLTAANPDLVPLDGSSIAITYHVPERTLIALDGDGTGTGAEQAIRLTDGSPPSNVTLRYDDPASTSDDIDFSSNGGASWNYAPVAGDLASEGAITDVRLRPAGTMAKQSSFAISLPFAVR